MMVPDVSTALEATGRPRRRPIASAVSRRLMPFSTTACGREPTDALSSASR
jgi:hypothetical protein